MNVVLYDDRYFLDIVRLVNNFHEEAVGEYDDLFDPNAVIETIKTQSANEMAHTFLLVDQGICQGILFGVTTKSLLNGRLIFQEVMWYVNKPYRLHGIKLLKTAEEVLRLKKVNIIIMAVLENSKTDKLKKFYERLGYKPMETHYVRSL